jgi:WD40 repeat protein
MGHSERVHSLALFNDGTRFLSASHDGTLRQWDIGTASTTHIYRGHTQAVHEVRLAPNQEQIASCGADGTVRLWNVNESTPTATSSVGNDVRGISFASSGSSIAAVCTNGNMRILVLEPSK